MFEEKIEISWFYFIFREKIDVIFCLVSRVIQHIYPFWELCFLILFHLQIQIISTINKNKLLIEVKRKLSYVNHWNCNGRH